MDPLLYTPITYSSSILLFLLCSSGPDQVDITTTAFAILAPMLDPSTSMRIVNDQ